AENAVDEAVRVTKPGGQVQIAPIQIMDFSAVQHVRENGIALMGRISEKYPKSSLKFKNPESSYLSHYTLTIIKPS
ncbi:MAG TPA: hypothetical protein VHE53_05340, partial [Patescibacteria group bacterium]|nr:hypothetical protein [Patescibacteria group bacterium]